MAPTAVSVVSLAPGLDVVDHYGDWVAEYGAARTGLALVDRPHRGWVQVRGADRVGWLHNLVTNEVKKLSPGEGAYAFAVTVKGRTVFDLNYLVDDEAIRLDIDRRWLAQALAHLDRYLIAEDVVVTDRSGDCGRLGLCGPNLKALFAELGVPNVPVMALMQHMPIQIAGATVRAFRSDFAGVTGVELVVPASERDAVWEALLRAGEAHGIMPVGWRAIQAVRIEQGTPWSIEDIDDQVVPPETGRTEEGISYHKGCYLGQEVIERLRSHGTSVRKLVGLRVEGDMVPIPGAALCHNGQSRGRVTSACHSPAIGGPLALGYLAVAQAARGTELEIRQSGISLKARVINLPVEPRT